MMFSVAEVFKAILFNAETPVGYSTSVKSVQKDVCPIHALRIVHVVTQVALFSVNN